VENQPITENISGKISDDFDLNIEKVINKTIIANELPNWGKADSSL